MLRVRRPGVATTISHPNALFKSMDSFYLLVACYNVCINQSKIKPVYQDALASC